jgi:uncharacterized protein
VHHTFLTRRFVVLNVTRFESSVQAQSWSDASRWRETRRRAGKVSSVEARFLIAPTQGVHTFGMRFSIDIIGVARDGRVVKIREHVPPRRIVLSFTAFAILELAAGVARRTKVAVGDRLVVVSTEQPPPL